MMIPPLGLLLGRKWLYGMSEGKYGACLQVCEQITECYSKIAIIFSTVLFPLHEPDNLRGLMQNLKDSTMLL
jgi:hypothetical protein